MRKIQFTLRDLFWLVLVVAMGFGWVLSYQRADSRADRATIQAKKWRLRTGSLEHAISTGDEKVYWHLDKGYFTINASEPLKGGIGLFVQIEHEPSIVDPLDE